MGCSALLAGGINRAGVDKLGVSRNAGFPLFKK